MDLNDGFHAQINLMIVEYVWFKSLIMKKFHFVVEHLMKEEM